MITMLVAIFVSSLTGAEITLRCPQVAVQPADNYLTALHARLT